MCASPPAQAFCLQLDDPVPFRFHWPTKASLLVKAPHIEPQRINPTGRGSTSKLGLNTRDQPYDLGAVAELQAGANTQVGL
jgi:hypothetical protein